VMLEAAWIRDLDDTSGTHTHALLPVWVEVLLHRSRFVVTWD